MYFHLNILKQLHVYCYINEILKKWESDTST